MLVDWEYIESTFAKALSVEPSTQNRRHHVLVKLKPNTNNMTSIERYTLIIVYFLGVLATLTLSMVIKMGRDISTDSQATEFTSAECSESYESTDLCISKKHMINPNDLINSSEIEFDFDPKFSQTIEVELCINEGSPCAEHYPKMKTMCRQKYLTIQLQVVAKNQTKSQLETFSIPSNCECVFYRQW
ncbi:CLUMA_CG014420, isoform A [Clunio marinus]|uniref:CLUMA_CG014420, isoform A n=1 Tax=Clunio marinus TaxID=568069 RepID=A0A1J1IP45_9DIPT|nr:CLUMA_CG014420, isoform A [Clunio marinus]